MYRNNNNHISLQDSQIVGLQNNYGSITVTTQSCNIATMSSNAGVISVAEFASVGLIQRNMGTIDLGRGSHIGMIERNAGTVTSREGNHIGMIKRNAGNIICEEQNRVGPIARNSGCVTIGANSVVDAISGNIGIMIFGDNCTIDMVSDNKETIKLGNYCVIKNVTGTVGNVTCGLGCQVPQADAPHPLPMTHAMTIRQGTQMSSMDMTMTIGPNGVICQNFNFNNGSWNYQFPYQHHTMPQIQTNQMPAAIAPQTQTTQQQDSDSSNDQLLCAICMERKKDTAFNCGHTCCGYCAGILQNCHICRCQIQQKIKLFL